MAITKTIDTELGVAATYFHINRRDIYDTDGVVDIGVRGYVSEEARFAGRENVFTWAKRYDLREGQHEVTKAEAYALIKQEEIFAGAQDI